MKVVSGKTIKEEEITIKGSIVTMYDKNGNKRNFYAIDAREILESANAEGWSLSKPAPKTESRKK